MPKRPRDLEFAKKLKELLLQKGIKKNADFAKAVAKAPTITWGWLHGRIPINRDDLELLSTFFGKSLDYIVLGRQLHPKEYRLDIAMSDKDKELIERTEGKLFVEKLVPIPIAKDPTGLSFISGFFLGIPHRGDDPLSWRDPVQISSRSLGLAV